MSPEVVKLTLTGVPCEQLFLRFHRVPASYSREWCNLLNVMLTTTSFVRAAVGDF
jgi:hypothetical protein